VATEILIVKLSSIGDVAMATVVLEPLKELFPQCRITWVVEPCCKDVIEGNDLVDRAVVWNKEDWIDAMKGFKLLKFKTHAQGFIKELKSVRYDIAIDLQGLLKSGVLTFISGAKHRVGLDPREGAQMFMTETFKSAEDKRIAGEYKQIMERHFNYKGPLKMHITLKQDVVLKTQEYLRRLGLNEYMVFCPFSSRPQKNWPVKYWTRLMNAITNEFSLPVVILGGEADRSTAEGINAIADQRAYNMAGQLSLAESIAFVSGAKAVVGVDTGLTHIAVGLSKPTVVLFGSTCPYKDPDGYSVEILYKELPCSPCKRNPTCKGDYKCMDSITVEEVMQALRRLMSEGSSC